MTNDPVRNVWLFKKRDFFISEGCREGVNRILDMRQLRRADDGRHHRFLLQQPRHCQTYLPAGTLREFVFIPALHPLSVSPLRVGNYPRGGTVRQRFLEQSFFLEPAFHQISDLNVIELREWKVGVLFTSDFEEMDDGDITALVVDRLGPAP